MRFENKTLKEYPVKRRVNTSRKQLENHQTTGSSVVNKMKRMLAFQENNQAFYSIADVSLCFTTYVQEKKSFILEEKLTLSSHRRITETICRGFRTGKSWIHAGIRALPQPIKFKDCRETFKKAGRLILVSRCFYQAPVSMYFVLCISLRGRDRLLGIPVLPPNENCQKEQKTNGRYKHYPQTTHRKLLPVLNIN